MRGLLDGAGRATGSTSATASTSSAPRRARSSPRSWPRAASPTRARGARRQPVGQGRRRRAGAAAPPPEAAATTARSPRPAGCGMAAAAPLRAARARRRRARRSGRAGRRARRRAAREALAARARAARRAVGRALRRAAADRRRRPPQRQARRVRRARLAATRRVAQAVLASCSIPWVFAPVEIDGREYVDGGVWSPTNLDATPARRGTQVLCLIPTAAQRGARLRSPTPPRCAESLALRARGASVRTIRPDRGAAEAMGQNLMDRAKAPEALAAGYAQGLDARRMSHQEINRAYWAGQAPDYAETARRDWADAEPSWGIWKHPGGRRRRAARRRRPRRHRARLRHRLLLRLARQARRPPGRHRPVARAARHRARDAGRARARVPAHRGRRRGRPAPGRELRLRALGVRREPVVRAGALDRRGRAAAAPGRAARVPHQLAAA